MNEESLPCADKIAFDTKRQAEDTAVTSEYWYGSKPHAYQCKHCSLWHLSTAVYDD